MSWVWWNWEISVPRADLEPTSVAFQASVLPVHHVGFPDVTTIPTPTCLRGSFASEVNVDYYIIIIIIIIIIVVIIDIITITMTSLPSYVPTCGSCATY